MQIIMIGAGAMGGVYGGLLTRKGFDVTLLDPRHDHIAVIRREGLIVEGVRGRHVVHLPAQSESTGLAPADMRLSLLTPTPRTPPRLRPRRCSSLMASRSLCKTASAMWRHYVKYWECTGLSPGSA